MTQHDRDAASPDGDRIAGLLGSMTDADFERTEPPADLFEGIAAQVASPVVEPVIEPGLDRPVVVSMDERRGMARSRWFVAAAVVALVAGVLTFLAVRDDAPSQQLLASAELRQLEPLGSTTATAKLVTENGRTHLVIDAANMAPPPEGSEYELWLIDRAVTDPRSLGTVTGSEDVIVPTSIDPADHPIVDISLEPKDGDQRHSGRSLMRGDLQ